MSVIIHLFSYYCLHRQPINQSKSGRNVIDPNSFFYRLFDISAIYNHKLNPHLQCQLRHNSVNTTSKVKYLIDFECELSADLETANLICLHTHTHTQQGVCVLCFITKTART